MTPTLLQSWYQVNLIAHIVAGAVGLLSMFIPLAARKGGTVHRKAGWVFVVAMATVAITGIGIALSWLVAPTAVRPPSRPLDPERLARYVEAYRTMGIFFSFVAVLVASAVWQGLVALWQRRGAIAWGNPVDRVFAWATLALGIVLTGVGLDAVNPVFIGFGLLGVSGGIGDLRFYGRTERPKNAWLLRHLQAMLGGATAATTAFTVQVVARMLADANAGYWQVLAWGLPPLLGIAATRIWSQRVRGSAATVTA